MPYIIQSSEKLRSYGSENEAKALFYMMGERADSKEIYYFVVDVFNDLTGMTKQADKLWDLQSKGDKSPSPKTIGKELVTLFKNYISVFEFERYIIFWGGFIIFCFIGAIQPDSPPCKAPIISSVRRSSI